MVRQAFSFYTASPRRSVQTFHEKPGDLALALRSALLEKRPTIAEVMTDDEITLPPPWRP